MNTILDSIYGTTRAAGCPSEHELALFYGDPRDDGTEITGGGYARVTVDEADWAAADDGAKSTTDFVVFPDATDEWSSEATHWALFDGSVLWSSGVTVDEDGGPLNVTGAGPGPLVRPTVRIAESITPNED